MEITMSDTDAAQDMRTGHEPTDIMLGVDANAPAKEEILDDSPAVDDTEDESQEELETLQDDSEEVEDDSEQVDDPEDEDLDQDDVQSVYEFSDGSEHDTKEVERVFKESAELSKQVQTITQERDNATALNKHTDDTLAKLSDDIELLAVEFLPQMPDASLREQDPDAYWAAKEDAQKAHAKIGQKVTNLKAEIKGRQDAAFLQAFPDHAEPVKRQAALESVWSTAQEYGYSADDLNDARDPRGLKMLMDIAELRSENATLKEGKGVREKIAKKKIIGKPKAIKPKQRRSQESIAKQKNTNRQKTLTDVNPLHGADAAALMMTKFN